MPVTRAPTSDDPVWVGIDLGTQGVRAVVAATDGRVLGRAERSLVSTRGRGRHEQVPERWWEALAAASRAALDGVAADQVRGVAIDSTSGTIMLVDRSGGPLTPGLMYDDARAVGEARRANDVGGVAWGSLGYRMQPTWALPKLLWMLDNWPQLVPGARLAHPCDYVNRRLVGAEVATDWSHALKTGYDLLHDAWPHAVLDRLGVPEGLLPDVVRPGSILGQVGGEGARETGIPVGTPVIAGMTDGCAAQIAAGALAEGSWSSTLGTTLVLKGASPDIVRDPNGVLYCHRSPAGGWLPGGASNVGAGVLSTAFPARDLDELAGLAARHERTEVLAYPLPSRGERFPFHAPRAEGFMLGQPQDDGEHFAALIQGLAFVERLCFDYLDLLGARTDGALSLTGGAARGRYLCQLRADVLGRPVTLLEHPDPALGMAVLAAADGRPLADVAADMVRAREVIGPRDGATARYLDRYLRLISELERRSWLDSPAADHARARAAL